MRELTTHGNTRPKVAVITRTKDRIILLRRAIESVLNQTFRDWCHVIVNDGGDRRVLEFVLEEYRGRYDGRLVVIHNEKPTGMQNASNAGIQASSSDYLAIHDDDDSWHPEFLAKTVAVLEEEGEESNFQGVITKTRMVFEEIRADGSVVQSDGGYYFWQNQVGLYRTAAENTFPPIAFLYRRSLHDELGLFNEKFSVLGDWDFNLRVLMKYDIATIPEVLANYHHRKTRTGGAYGNTVTTGVAEHREKETVLRNHYLREDLRTGKVGLGHLLHQAGAQFDTDKQLADISRNIHALHQRAQNTAPHAAGSHPARATLPHYSRKAVKLSSGVSEATITKRISACELLSLDIFDTALFRKLRRPVDVFELLEWEARQAGEIDDLPLAQARFSAERIARWHRLQACGDDEVTLDEIYEQFGKLAGLGPATTLQLKQRELAIERRVLYPNPKILRVAQAAAREGKRIAFVSDMYLPQDYVGELLREVGYSFELLLLSNAERTSKYSGGLFRILMERSGVSPEDILHVGDHPVSDDSRPSSMGLQTIRYSRGSIYIPLAEHLPSETVLEKHGLISSAATGLARKERLAERGGRDEEEQLARLLGYEVAGPIYYGFGRWLLENALADGIQNLCFLARDGQHLRDAVEKMATHWGISIHTSYLMASRRLLCIPAIKSLDAKWLQTLLKPNPGLTVGDFIQRIGLQPANYREDLKKCNLLPDLKRVVTNRWHQFNDTKMRGRLEKFFKLVESDILENARQERKLLRQYLSESGLDRSTSAVVDIGWSGSLAAAVHHLVDGRSAHNLRAYYFGTWDTAQTAMDTGCSISSYFCHLNEPLRRRDILMHGVELVELLLMSPHPTINGIRRGSDGSWLPVYGPSLLSKRQTAILNQIREGALAFIDNMLDILPVPPPPGDLDNHIEVVLKRLLEYPTKAEATLLGGFLHVDGFGGFGVPRPLACPPTKKRWLTGHLISHQDMQQAYESSYWKRGFLAALSGK